MSNKGLTVIIIVLVLLCAATFGAFYLKMNPQLALSQQLFGGQNQNPQDSESGDLNSPFGSSEENNAGGSALVENTVSGTGSGTFTQTDGVTVTPMGNADETAIPNTTTVTVPDTSSDTSSGATTVDSGSVNPSPATSAPQLTQTLRRGSKGNEVKILQQFLIDNEYLTGKADGIFGAGTEASVKKFQTEYKLTADGIVGGKTRMTINELLAAE